MQGTDWSASRGEKWSLHLTGMEAMLRPVDEPLLEALRLDTPSRIAEVGSGGGSTTRELLRRAPSGSLVHGFDISAKLVEVARERTSLDENAIAFKVADMATARPEQPYDRLVSRFGVMFFDDAPAAFANLLHWLAPGGRFAFAVWGPPSENRWFTSAREVVGKLVEIPQQDPEGPGPFRYGDANKLLALLTAAGFTGLEVRDWRGALPIGGVLSPEDAARFALSAFAMFSELLSAAGSDVQNEAHRALTSCYVRHFSDGAVHMESCVHIVTGARS